MLIVKRFSIYPLPYSLLISRICDYKKVSTNEEKVQHTRALNKIGQGELKQVGFIYHGNVFIHKGDVSTKDNEDDEGLPHAPPVVGSSSFVDASSSSIYKNIANINRRMEEMFLLHASRHEEVYILIRNLDNTVTNIETQLGALFVLTMIKKREATIKF